MKSLKILITCLLLTSLAFSGKPPQLTPNETHKKIEEILQSHVSYKTFTSELAKRSIKNFIDDLDPLKTYFLKGEIAAWIEPERDQIHNFVTDYNLGKFTQFQEIYAQFVTAVTRRNQLDVDLENTSLPKAGNPAAFKALNYAETEKELFERLLQVRAIQNEAAQKLGEQAQNRFAKAIKKRRLSRESDLIEGNEKEKEQRMLGCAMKAISGALDAHTAYFTPTEAKQFLIDVQRRLFGIGAQLRDDLNGLTVVHILEGAPSLGLIEQKDRIIAVDDEPIIGMDISDAVELIRGPKGSPVKLTLIRDDTKHTVEVVRDEIVLNETRLSKEIHPFGDGVIAHLTLHSFYQDETSSSAGDLREAIEKIRAENKLKGIILDLRSNMGGLMTQAVAVSGLFIKKGVVVSTKDCYDRVIHLRNFDASIAWDGPLFILTNKATVSASEIVAQTLQEYGRALIVGDATTFGKGTYQTFTLDTSLQNKVNPEGEYKVTRGLYYTVSGHSPQLHGAKANIVVPGIYSASEFGESQAKFPLEPGSIDPSFDDKLEDIHPLHRLKMKRIYHNDLQEVETTYIPYLEMLKSNSHNRINNNTNYQSFLKALEDDNPSQEHIGKTDLQLEETMNIMKDLLFMQRHAA